MNDQAGLPPVAPPALPVEGAQPAAAPAPAPEAAAPGPAVPVQVDRTTFLAARLRETLAEAANLRDQNADLLKEVGALRKENAAYRADIAQAEIDGLDKEFDVGKGTILQRRPDGTYWRIPPEALRRASGQA